MEEEVLKQLVRQWMAPPRYQRGGVWANRAGFQVARVIVEAGSHALRRRFARREFIELMLDLDRNGFVVVPNFLPADAFVEVRKAFEDWGRSELVKTAPDYRGTGVTWTHGTLTTGQTQAAFAGPLIEHLAKNGTILALVSYVMRRRVMAFPELHYQSLRLTEGRSDDRDKDSVLHADRHFHTVKASLMLNENTTAGGAYVYCPGSHRLSWARLQTEYDLSVRGALVRSGRGAEIPLDLVERGRNIIAPSHRASMRLEERSVVGQPNTLVLSNNRGFHRRGRLEPGATRQQIRIVFHQEEIGWLGRIARAVLRPQAPGAGERRGQNL